MVDPCNRSTWNAEIAGTWVPYKTWAAHKARLCFKEVKENKKHWQCMEKQGEGERGSSTMSHDRGAQFRNSDSWHGSGGARGWVRLLGGRSELVKNWEEREREK